jgi:hypothetical protein
VRSELRALLTRAADCEASKQRAKRDGDLVRVEALEAELRKLWSRHADLEQRCA